MNRLAIALLLGTSGLLWAAPAPAEKRRLANAREIYRELRIAEGRESAVVVHFPSFREYQELMLYHAAFGYYSSGHVRFANDYQTFPHSLAPYFGQMVAQQIFRMWEGMRRAGTLGRREKFTIAEIGAGDGVLAESILDFLDEQKQESSDPQWREFASQVVYICYDRAPVLTEVQRRRNARFGSQFEARNGDATSLNASIPPGSLTGVILSNELLDVFGVHKVILSENGSAEAAFVAPSLSPKAWSQIRGRLSAVLQQSIASHNRAIEDTVLGSERDADTYLSRQTLVALLESVATAKDYDSLVQAIQFHEVYVPVAVLPELAEHLRRYAHIYASQLASTGKGMVVYVNLGQEKFIRGAGAALSAGYVMTIDYGSNWNGMMALGQPHLRTYGPGTQSSPPGGLLTDLTREHGETADVDATAARGRPDPYRWPTLNDITSDVNFSHLAAEGRSAGLRTVYFGPQRALQSGTSISFTAKTTAPRAPNRQREINAWWTEFTRDARFKLLIQQKQATDDAYLYPDRRPEPVDFDENRLSAAERRRAAGIEQSLLSRE